MVIFFFSLMVSSFDEPHERLLHGACGGTVLAVSIASFRSAVFDVNGASVSFGGLLFFFLKLYKRILKFRVAGIGFLGGSTNDERCFLCKRF